MFSRPKLRYRPLKTTNTLRQDHPSSKNPKIDMNEILHNPEVKSLVNSATDGAVTELVKASDAGKMAIFKYTRNVLMGILTATALRIESVSGLSEQQIETTLAIAAFIGVGILGLKHIDHEQVWNKLCSFVGKKSDETLNEVGNPTSDEEDPPMPEIEVETESSHLDRSFAHYSAMPVLELQVKALVLKRDLVLKYHRYDLIDRNDVKYMEMQIFQSLLKQKSPESTISSAIVYSKIDINDINAILKVAKLAEALIMYFNVVRVVAEAYILYHLNKIIMQNHFNILIKYPDLLLKHQNVLSMFPQLDSLYKQVNK